MVSIQAGHSGRPWPGDCPPDVPWLVQSWQSERHTRPLLPPSPQGFNLPFHTLVLQSVLLMIHVMNHNNDATGTAEW